MFPHTLEQAVEKIRPRLSQTDIAKNTWKTSLIPGNIEMKKACLFLCQKWEYKGNTNVDHLVVESPPFHQRIPPLISTSLPQPIDCQTCLLLLLFRHITATAAHRFPPQNEIFKEWLLFADKNVNVRESHVIPIYMALCKGGRGGIVSKLEGLPSKQTFFQQFVWCLDVQFRQLWQKKVQRKHL